MIAQPDNVGFYAVAKAEGKVLVAVGPLPASDAHRAVDAQVRPEARERGNTLPPFLDFGVLRLVAKPGRPLPVYTITAGRIA
jgi:hypothetical protein